MIIAYKLHPNNLEKKIFTKKNLKKRMENRHRHEMQSGKKGEGGGHSDACCSLVSN